ncbi:MAG TPA: cytochrome oxidase small assembly protein [Burkholderiales bacterium]|nr:cytochrome oxidase small assembly protein [Burkholderiales bacterium]
MTALDPQTKSRNRRTAIVLWSIVALFFFAIVMKYWMLR